VVVVVDVVAGAADHLARLLRKRYVIFISWGSVMTYFWQ
jgi:hypothetical protein